MTVLEAFVHDPLVEWTKVSASTLASREVELMHQKRSKNTDVRATGEKNLGPIKKKLAGIIQEKGMVMTVPNQVDWLIKQATGPAQLVSLPNLTS
jgi:serine/threonine-protein kinase ATR